MKYWVNNYSYENCYLELYYHSTGIKEEVSKQSKFPTTQKLSNKLWYIHAMGHNDSVWALFLPILSKL